jgi:TonB family protein
MLVKHVVLFAALLFALRTWAGDSKGSCDQKQIGSADTTVYQVRGDVKAPRPLSTPSPILPPERTDKERKVRLSFVVTPEGTVRDIKVIKRFKPEWDRGAVDAVSKWTFQPATKDGKAVAVRLETEFKFTPQ